MFCSLGTDSNPFRSKIDCIIRCPTALELELAILIDCMLKLYSAILLLAFLLHSQSAEFNKFDNNLKEQNSKVNSCSGPAQSEPHSL